VFLGVVIVGESSAESNSPAVDRIPLYDTKDSCLGLAEEISNHLADIVGAMSSDDRQYFYLNEVGTTWALAIFTLRDLSYLYDMYSYLDSVGSPRIEQRSENALLEILQQAVNVKVERLSARVVLDVRSRAKDIENAFAVVQMLKMADRLEAFTRSLSSLAP